MKKALALTLMILLMLQTTTTAFAYTITYKGNGNTKGAVPVDNESHPFGKEVTVLYSSDLEKSGYVFAGWTIGRGGMTTYTPYSTLVMPDRDVELYAKWIRRSITDTRTYSDTPEETKFKALSPEEAAAIAQSAAETAKAFSRDMATLYFENVSTVSAEALQAISEAAGMRFELVANSYAMDSLGVDVRVTIANPGTDEALKLGASTASISAKETKTYFETWFANKVAVIALDQVGSFDKTASIAAKLDLSGMNEENLVFYSYDTKTNAYKKLDIADYYVDINGYLRFNTKEAGTIVIADGILLKK